MGKIELFKDAKKQPHNLEELKTALEKYQGLQYYLEAPEEDMVSEWWPLDVVHLLPFDPLGQVLPHFGGALPGETHTTAGEKILSWDEGRLLVGADEDIKIISRG